MLTQKYKGVKKWLTKEREINFVFNDSLPFLEISEFGDMNLGIRYIGESREYYTQENVYNPHNVLLSIPNYLFISYSNIKEKTDFLEKLNFDDNSYEQLFNFKKEIEKKVRNELNKTTGDNEVVEKWTWRGNLADEIIITVFLAFCKKNRKIKYYWEPYIDSLCELGNQGDLEIINQEHYIYIHSIIEDWLYQGIKKEKKNLFLIHREKKPFTNEHIQ